MTGLKVIFPFFLTFFPVFFLSAQSQDLLDFLGIASLDNPEAIEVDSFEITLLPFSTEQESRSIEFAEQYVVQQIRELILALPPREIVWNDSYLEVRQQFETKISSQRQLISASIQNETDELSSLKNELNEMVQDFAHLNNSSEVFKELDPGNFHYPWQLLEVPIPGTLAEIDLEEKPDLILPSSLYEEPSLIIEFDTSLKTSELLIGGRIDQINELISLAVYIISPKENDPIFRFVQRYDSLDSFYNNFSLSREFTEHVLGRDYADLSVELNEENAALYLDEQLIALGSSRIQYLNPGDYKLEIKKDGFITIQENITLRSQEELALEFTLEPDYGSVITLVTYPISSVYRNSQLLGTTPVQIPLPLNNELISFRRDGYTQKNLLLGPDSELIHKIQLEPNYVDWSVELARRRDNFYISLGAFALTTVVPIIFDGLYNESLVSLDSSASNYSEILNRSSAYEITRNFGLVVSAILLTNLIDRLVDYLAVIKRLEEQ